MTTGKRASRQLALLGILLLALHVVFGITLIIALLIAHTKIGETHDSTYHSHLRWQIITAWLGLAGYGIAWFLYIEHALQWPALLVLGFMIYRIGSNIYYWIKHRPITRLI